MREPVIRGDWIARANHSIKPIADYDLARDGKRIAALMQVETLDAQKARNFGTRHGVKCLWGNDIIRWQPPRIFISAFF